jgi:hypothetical protein
LHSTGLPTPYFNTATKPVLPQASSPKFSAIYEVVPQNPNSSDLPNDWNELPIALRKQLQFEIRNRELKKITRKDKRKPEFLNIEPAFFSIKDDKGTITQHRYLLTCKDLENYWLEAGKAIRALSCVGQLSRKITMEEEASFSAKAVDKDKKVKPPLARSRNVRKVFNSLPQADQSLVLYRTDKSYFLIQENANLATPHKVDSRYYYPQKHKKLLAHRISDGEQ